MRRIKDLLKRFRRNESGSFLEIFALLAIVLIATSGAVVDFTYTQTARSRAQTALDAAALALQSEITQVNNGTITQSAAEADIKTKSQQILKERLNDNSITATVDSASIDTTQGTLNLTASLTVPTAFVQLVGIRTINAKLASQATRGSKDIELSVALDITGSMAGSKLTALQSATQWLVDNVVKSVQVPTYSKMAIVPWSQAVNVSSTYAANVRGTPTPGTAISAASWSNASASISGVTRANPGVVTTTTNHGFSNGDIVYISGVKGMTQLNGSTYKVQGVTSNTFQLYTTGGSAVNTSSYSKYSSAGTVQRCTLSTCEITITSNSHGLSAGDHVNITGVSGLSSPLNVNGLQTVGAVTTNTFVWSGSFGPTETAYTSGGTAYCVKYGCTYYYFLNAAGSYLLYQVNTCATERVTNAFTDAPPSTTKLNFNYSSGGAACLSQTIQPLTADKTVLTNVVNGLTAANSTAGHLGLAWGWYMVSPTFVAGIPNWPSTSVPAAYGRANLIKAVVLMTDGAFNIQYCNGVLSMDSSNGTSSTKINCNAPDGDSRSVQAAAICNAIKAPANQTLLYTVGFQLGTDTASLNFLQGCATSPDMFFQADTNTDLQTAFQKIAQDLETLRISH